MVLANKGAVAAALPVLYHNNGNALLPLLGGVSRGLLLAKGNAKSQAVAAAGGKEDCCWWCCFPLCRSNNHAGYSCNAKGMNMRMLS